jgi:hypothetical protein
LTTSCDASMQISSAVILSESRSAGGLVEALYLALK